ncbi:MAG: deoxyhypusine synthase family protein [Halobacteriovoraceae bacterium]|nr:deoxyhypusine synthase family protein [Halobacteriovoraceae bacterium]
MGVVSDFIKDHFKHFNAAVLVDAADAYRVHVEKGGSMLVTLAGAMSTAELGRSLSHMIRENKVHAICCTGANMEEDIFNLVAHEYYQRVPHYRQLSEEDEIRLLERGMNRVTDTCIPEQEAMRRVESFVIPLWEKADKEGKTWPVHEFLWEILDNPNFQKLYQIDPAHSWMIAAKEKNIPVFVPGQEDSTLGNMFAALVMKGDINRTQVIENGSQLMVRLAKWYQSRKESVGFFQIGGGIAGDFPICVVPMLRQDLKRNSPLWGYFCQISDSTTSYGSYSGATPSEKITWGKLDVDTPKFIIESDATIVAPLVFARVLDW